MADNAKQDDLIHATEALPRQEKSSEENSIERQKESTESSLIIRREMSFPQQDISPFPSPLPSPSPSPRTAEPPPSPPPSASVGETSTVV
jgi:hypothetical protein